ncbi:N-acyl-phosphatidylethanolamine-hydrolyzing phospholipase D [Nematocida ausubeli]|nr:N-acyl-phosphatidylethanolamine-hydrolyzing phospholipase D [Nematocida ausubeli]
MRIGHLYFLKFMMVLGSICAKPTRRPSAQYEANNPVNHSHSMTKIQFKEKFMSSIEGIEYNEMHFLTMYFSSRVLKWNYMFVYPSEKTPEEKKNKMFVYTESDSVLESAIVLNDTIDISEDLSDLHKKINQKKNSIYLEESAFQEAGKLCIPFTNKQLGYRNPKSFSTWFPRFIYPKDVIAWMLSKEKPFIPEKSEIEEKLPVVTPAFVLDAQEYIRNTEESAVVTWLGHASALVTISGINILADPVFSNRASSFPNTVGPIRHVPPPCTAEALPVVHAVLISHSHHDHFDPEAVKVISKKSPDAVWFVPLGFDAHLMQYNIKNIVCMGWGEIKTHTYTLESGKKRRIKVTSVPAQHWGCRTGIDIFRELWCGWIATVSDAKDRSISKTMYFAGDTGMCRKEFLKIGMWFNIDLALIPIGCYEPSWFIYPQHVSPKEALILHQIIKAKKSVAIHWGTYDMGTTEDFLQPRDDLIRDREALGMDSNEFITVCPGELISF